MTFEEFVGAVAERVDDVEGSTHEGSIWARGIQQVEMVHISKVVTMLFTGITSGGVMPIGSPFGLDTITCRLATDQVGYAAGIIREHLERT